jgi:hypothetical protein
MLTQDSDLEQLRHFSLSWPSLKVYRHITFRLALQAGIPQRRKPTLQLAIIFEPAIFHRLVEPLAHVVEHNPGFFITRNGKADTIRTTIGGHMTTTTRITNIAELPQLNF